MSVVMLRDGTFMNHELVEEVYHGLRNFKSYSSNALNDLVNLCNGEMGKLLQSDFESKRAALKRFQILDENNHLSEHKKRIILNSIEVTQYFLSLQDPRQPLQQSVSASRRRGWCVLL